MRRSAPVSEATCFGGAYKISVPENWMHPDEVKATGLDHGPWAEQFVSRAAYDGPGFATIMVTRKPRFKSMRSDGAPSRTGGERLEFFVEDQEMGNTFKYRERAAERPGPLPARVAAAWLASYTTVGRQEGLLATTQCVLFECDEEDVIVRLNNAETEGVDFEALCASFRVVQRQVCASCGQAAAKLSQCAACKSAVYCSRRCQVAHWKSGHKAECPALARAIHAGGGIRPDNLSRS